MGEEEMKQEPMEQPKSKKELFIAQYKKRYPDAGDFEDDEQMFGDMSERYGKESEEYDKMKDRENKMVDLFSRDPRAGMMFAAMRDGKDLLTFLVETFGSDFMDAIQDPEKADDFAEAQAKWMEKVKKNKELEVQAEKNLEETLDVFRGKVDSGEWTEDHACEVFAKCQQIVVDGLSGKVSPETIEMVDKAMNYKTDVDDAMRKGEVKGRNAKIVEKLKDQSGNGVPTLNGSGASMGEKKKVYNPFLASNQ